MERLPTMTVLVVERHVPVAHMEFALGAVAAEAVGAD